MLTWAIISFVAGLGTGTFLTILFGAHKVHGDYGYTDSTECEPECECKTKHKPRNPGDGQP